VIDAVGPGVPGTQIGRRVWTWNAQWRRPFGTAANYATVPLEQAVDLPGNVSFDQGASLGVPALTAYYCISRMTFGSNEPIYISGGGGVIGRYAIQMAKSRGATVVTTVSSDCKAELARAAGADLVVNYRTQSVRDVVSGWLGQETIKNFMAVDLAANIDEIRGIAGKFSRIVVYGSATDMAPACRCWTCRSTT
jgi:NADPH2:quinone reductase